MNKVNIFLSYAREDKTYKDEIDKALIGLKKNGQVDVWHDQTIEAGMTWSDEIKNAIDKAHIFLLLISSDFNNSEYIWENELAAAMKKHEEKKARVIPIICRTCDWTSMPYSKFQAIPPGVVPIDQFTNKDEAYTIVAKNIKSVVNYFIENNMTS